MFLRTKDALQHDKNVTTSLHRNQDYIITNKYISVVYLLKSKNEKKTNYVDIYNM